MNAMQCDLQCKGVVHPRAETRSRGAQDKDGYLFPSQPGGELACEINLCGTLQQIEEFKTVYKYEANSGKGDVTERKKSLCVIVVTEMKKCPCIGGETEMKKFPCVIGVTEK